VNERRGVQRVAVALALELPVGDGTQLGVNEGHQPIPRRGIVARPTDFEIGDFGLLTHHFRPLRSCAAPRAPIGGLSASSWVYRIYL
jgi:hypothetical protein